MNIIINKEQFEYIKENQQYSEYIVGSVLYGVNNKNSDKDILWILEDEFLSLKDYYPNIHQLQYKDIENNIDYLITTKTQFLRNAFNGESTINVDLLLYNEQIAKKYNISFIDLRTYKIIKAYLGFAKRDLKMLSKNDKDKKLKHIARSLYIAICFINNVYPNLFGIEHIYISSNYDIDYLIDTEKTFRIKLNEMYEKNEITNYYISPLLYDTDNKSKNEILKLFYDANNVKEFKY